MSFSNWAYLEFHMNAYTDHWAIQAVLSGMEQIQGDTNTADAIAYARDVMFKVRGENREIEIRIEVEREKERGRDRENERGRERGERSRKRRREVEREKERGREGEKERGRGGRNGM